MVKLYTDEEYLNSKSTDKLLLQCENCNNHFLKMKKLITQALNNRPGACRFCSHKCSTLQRKNEISITCDNCNILFTKRVKEINKTKNHFCCRSCAATYKNKHKTLGAKISKLEKYLQKQLIELYPNLEFMFNDKSTINSELDIYIPSLKLAFELNGIFHYEPIYGENKLNQIQNNDKNKFQLCQQHNISLCVIDTSPQKYFKEQTSNKFLNIIRKIIDDSLQQLAI